MRRLIMSWAVGLAFLALQGAAGAQSTPSGSYQSTCKNIDVRDGVLSANCRDMDGKWEATQLRDYRSCGSDIMNDNGALRCGDSAPGPAAGYQGGYQAGVPTGSYTQTCQEIRVHGDDLEARCQTTDGNWHKTKLDDFQKCRGDVANDNGSLHCVNNGPSEYQGGFRGGYPRGAVGTSYTQSCKDIKSHGDHLEARCKTVNGDWRNTSLDDYRKCHGQIINDDGNLRCVAGYAGGPVGYAGNFPAGSYTQTCQDVHVNGDDLEARCSTANGDWRSSKLDDFQKCRGDIINDDGHLRCSK